MGRPLLSVAPPCMPLLPLLPLLLLLPPPHMSRM
jgi:hypothetical protein